MGKIVIYGSGGVGREVAHLIQTINNFDKGNDNVWEILGFLNDYSEHHGTIVNDLPVLGGIEWLKNQTEEVNVVIAIGSSKGKKQVLSNLTGLRNVNFPNLIHPSVNISKYNKLGQGNIICEGSILTVNINLGDFVILSVNCTIGHDTVIGSYSTILPNASVSGNVIFGECVDFGTNATIIEKKTIGDNTIVGAGAVVINDLPANCTAVGAPAKPIKFNDEI